MTLKKIAQLVLFLICTYSYAQLGIGTTSPNTSSQLDVVSNNKGILIPQIALTSETDTNTISNGNVESLLVYNTTNAGGLTPGYYYWSNATWNRIAITTDASSLSVVDNLSSTSATDALSALQGSVLKALVDANTAKETNATHTGDVTGDVALTIASNAVTNDKIASGIDKAKVGLSEVDNTSDIDKPISTATQTALDNKENVANKDIDGSLSANSDTNYPSQKAVKTYVDGFVKSVTFLGNDRKLQLKDANENIVSETTLATLVKTVNGNQPDGDGNVDISVASVNTGVFSSRPGTASEGQVYVVSNDNPTTNGKAYIYDADTTTWYEIAPLDQASSDTRYVNTTGDFMSGELDMSTNKITNVKTPDTGSDAANKQYVDDEINAIVVPDATSGIKGIVKLAGDLSGSADVPVIADNAVTVSKIGTAGATDANKMLTTDASGNPQWENKLTAVTHTGDVTGSVALTIADDAVTNDKIADNAVNGSNIALGSDATGDLMYYNGTDWARLPAGAAAQTLSMNAAATFPEWVTPSTSTATLSRIQVSTTVTINNFSISHYAFNKTVFLQGSDLSLSNTGSIDGLQAGKTYRITARLQNPGVGSGDSYYRIVDLTTNTTIGIHAALLSINQSYLSSSLPTLEAFFTPTVTTSVGIDFIGGSIGEINNNSTFTVEEVPTTAGVGTGGGGSSVTVTDNLTTSSSAAALSANQGKVLNDNKLDNTLTNGSIFIGDASDNASAQTLSGDATITNAGVLTIADNAVTTAKIGTSGATDANKILTTDASGNPQWENKPSTNTITHIGDTKNGFQAADHSGWIKLDGRAITTLTTSQQAQATTLGFTPNLPNDSQNGKEDGSNIYQSNYGWSTGDVPFIETLVQNIPSTNVSKNASSIEFTLSKGKYLVTWNCGYGTTGYVYLKLILNNTVYRGDDKYATASAGGQNHWNGSSTMQTIIDATSSNQTIKFNGSVGVATIKITKLKDNSESKFIYLGE